MESWRYLAVLLVFHATPTPGPVPGLTIADEIESISPRPAWSTSRLQGAPEPPPPFRLIPAFPRLQFEKPSSLLEIPGENRLLATEMGGRILSFPKDARVERADLVIDLRVGLSSGIASADISLFSATLHPRFIQNRFLFICYVHPGKGGHTRVSRIQLTTDRPPRAVTGSEQVLITWPSGGHNAGCLHFGSDGMLYISTGDGSGPNPPDGLTTGQDISDLLGAILRIDVDHASGDKPYRIPGDNPFVGFDGARPEIWAYGLRNPWKFGIDSATGAMYAADNGWESWETIHEIVRGGNCGWPIMEGRAALRTEVAPGPTPIRPPVKDHPHTEANSVIGGPIYRGDKLPELDGSFIYGDYITGTIWALGADAQGEFSHRTLVDTDQRIVAFTQGSQGELYVVDYDFTGQIYELAPSEWKDSSDMFPRRLSETGLFDSLDNLTPAAGVVPYEVRVSRWLDGAEAKRWVAVPGHGQIRLADGSQERAVYPEGTVLVKHLELPQGNGKPIRLETQILHFEHGAWHPYTYQWDDAGDEAHLVDSIGATRTLAVIDSTTEGGLVERSWHLGAHNECRLCHNAGSHYILGFTSSQLARSIQAGPWQGGDQASILVARNVIAPTLDGSDETGGLVNPHDTSETLEDRARSYLHVNCGMCHHPGGNAIVSFYLRRDMPLDQLNVNKGTGIGTFGIRNARILTSGDPFRSILLYRMSKLGYARMPYIGSQVVDSRGVALVSQWIRSLPRENDGEPSGPLTRESVESRALETLSANQAPSDESKEQAIRQLIASTEGTLALVTRMHAGLISREDAELVVAIGRQSKRSDILGLIEHFIPESERRARLGPTIDPQTILQRDGDPARGKLIFQSDSARCRDCHDAFDQATSLGPSIVEINKKYPRPSELLQHVLQPSLKIDERFVAYTLTTKTGQIVTGMIKSGDDSRMVIETAERKTIVIQRDEVEDMRKSTRSLMPEQILSDLTAQEAADLLAYLSTITSTNTAVEGN